MFSTDTTTQTAAALSPDTARVIDRYRTCEFATITRSGTAIAWPTIPLYDAGTGTFTLTTSIGQHLRDDQGSSWDHGFALIPKTSLIVALSGVLCGTGQEARTVNWVVITEPSAVRNWPQRR